MTQLIKGTAEQIMEAYRAMATTARYRPAAPDDGFGNITVPMEKLDLEREAVKYAHDWWKEEDDCKFFVGCCNFESRKATIFAIEAARQMCAGRLGDLPALALLKMAVAEMESRMTRDNTGRKAVRESGEGDE